MENMTRGDTNDISTRLEARGPYKIEKLNLLKYCLAILLLNTRQNVYQNLQNRMRILPNDRKVLSIKYGITHKLLQNVIESQNQIFKQTNIKNNNKSNNK